MRSYLAQRLLISLVLFWLVGTGLFFFVRVMPGDPAMIILGAGEGLGPTPAELSGVRSQLGLDKPLHEQYRDYVVHLAQGDLGQSLLNGRPVALDVRLRLGRTLQLMIPALVISSVLGIMLGLLGARSRGRVLDPLLSIGGLAGFSVPVFVVGTVLVLTFSIDRPWLPSSGYAEITRDPIQAVRYMVMPVITLALAPLAVTMRMTRTAIVEELALDYVRTARAKGLGERVVLMRHVLKNAMLPVLAVIGLQVGAAVSGSVIVESVFNWPGMGLLLLQSISFRDYPVIQAVVLVGSGLFIFVNFLTDSAYRYVNPRVQG